MEPVLNQVILVGEVDSIVEEGVLRVVVDGVFVEVYVEEDMWLNLPDNVEDLDALIGVKGHIENTPAGNLMIVADMITYLAVKENESEGQA